MMKSVLCLFSAALLLTACSDVKERQQNIEPTKSVVAPEVNLDLAISDDPIEQIEALESAISETVNPE